MCTACSPARIFIHLLIEVDCLFELRSEHAGHCIPGQVCLSSRYSLIPTFVVCLEIEEEQFYSFHARRRLRPRSCFSGKPLVFHLRYAFQVLQIRSQCQNSGIYRAFNLIKSSTIAFGSTTSKRRCILGAPVCTKNWLKTKRTTGLVSPSGPHKDMITSTRYSLKKNQTVDSSSSSSIGFSHKKRIRLLKIIRFHDCSAK